MTTMMTSRFAEWNRRAKENKRLKPLIMRDMQEDLQEYMDEDYDDPTYDKEDLRNIENSTTTFK
jgi:hypothetical protein